MREEGYFEKALSGLVRDVACGDAIRHLSDLGFSPAEIREKLDYPVALTVVGEVMWKHLEDRGVILKELPDDDEREESSYLREYDAYGRASYRKVVTMRSISKEEYVECSFGKELRKGKEALEASLSGLSESDRDYVLSLPWPLCPVYHIKDERIGRILNAIKS